MKYFGTDGIRGLVDKKFNKTLLNKIGKSIIKFYTLKNFKKVLIIGNDGRDSCDYILTGIQETLIKHGMEIHNIGLCSTPCLAYITKKYNYPLGIMISASHNNYEYNGIKFFNSDGEKFSTEDELLMEQYMDSPLNISAFNYGHIKDYQHLKQAYITNLKMLLKCQTDSIFDCSNGGSSKIVSKIFYNNLIISNKPNGKNINENCGCTHIEQLQSLCKKLQKNGFAFDGDADRVIAVDKDGSILDGNKILFIFAKFFLTYNDIVVGTKNSNEGLKDALLKRKIKFIRADVGDKNVYSEMKKAKSKLGGEDCGHIIYNPLTNTGDGVLTAILLINILSATKLTFSELLTGYTSYYQAQENLKLTKPFKTTKELTNKIKELELLGSRIVIRPSGTEPTLRLLVENKEETTALYHMSLIKNILSLKDL